ncbi:LLM class flavin-dependent oxidoreductase [Niallia sp. FSL W8-0951]|uniref:LLM class flavin-dependent oxidoreductase n=1 Tax=Niallia TaxID=2837506 RepID=UPI002E219D79|nr:LLM class flavin-dependent oxidoreductase [Niallia circulans]
MTITLSILDQSPIGEVEKAEIALQNTVKLAKVAEELGYHRFWVSEHHNNTQLAGSAPEALIGYLLAKTKKLRIGSGGVMLQHYSPYKVAEVFHVLASLEPNRVDLGVGKAPGGLNLSTQALQEDKKPLQKDFVQKLSDLQKFINNEEKVQDLKATPITTNNPDLFLLGGSVESAEIAARLGISYVFAYFINGDESVLNEARERFEKFSPKNAKNKFLLALTIVVAETDSKATSYIKHKETVKVIFSDGRKVNVNSLEHAQKVLDESEETEYQLIVQKAGYLAGSMGTVKKQLIQLIQKYNIDEVIALSPIVEIESRIHSYKLLKRAFETEKYVRSTLNEGMIS